MFPKRVLGSPITIGGVSAPLPNHPLRHPLKIFRWLIFSEPKKTAMVADTQPDPLFINNLFFVPLSDLIF